MLIYPRTPVHSLSAFLSCAGNEFYLTINIHVNVSISVAANLRKVIDDPPSSKSMTFPLVSIFLVSSYKHFLNPLRSNINMHVLHGVF